MQNFVRRQSGIFDVRQLMSASVHHAALYDEVVLSSEIVQLRTRISVGD